MVYLRKSFIGLNTDCRERNYDETEFEEMYMTSDESGISIQT